MLKDFLAFILRLLAQATLWRYKPEIIGITGSVGKTSTKEAIFAVLKNRYSVRKNIKNYNNEIGVPLTIIGQPGGNRSIFAWTAALIAGFFKLIYTKYPKILILEMGADKIGDIAYLMSFIKLNIGVVTTIGEIPVHVESFQNPGQVAQEKAKLVKNLKGEDWAILNFDDLKVRAMAEKIKSKILFYGFEAGSNLRVSNFEQKLDDLARPTAIFKVDYEGSNVPIHLKNIFSAHQVYPVLAAMAVGITFNMNLIEIAQALKEYEPPAGRFRLLSGIKHSWIIDDSYNASPASTLAALETLQKLPGRKIAALGDMLELGSYTEQAHRQIGRSAASIVDLLFAVGERSIFMQDEAKKAGLAGERVMHFASSDEAGRVLQNMIRENDVILVKGSQGVRMEKIVKEIMAEPQKAEELLVRQDKAWRKK